MGSDGLLCDGVAVHHAQSGGPDHVQRLRHQRCAGRLLDLAADPSVVAQTLLESVVGDVPHEEVLRRHDTAAFGRVAGAGGYGAASAGLFPLCGGGHGCAGVQRFDARHRARRPLYPRTYADAAGAVHRLAGRLLQHRQGDRDGGSRLPGRCAGCAFRGALCLDDHHGGERSPAVRAGSLPLADPSVGGRGHDAGRPQLP